MGIKSAIRRFIGPVLLVSCAAMCAAFAWSTQSGEEQSAPPGTPKTEQKARVNPAIPRLVLGNQSATLGENVVVPLYYDPPQGAELRSISAEVEWVSKNLKFVRAEAGISPQSVGAKVGGKITGTTKDEKSLEHSTLRIDVSVEDDAKQVIPTGLLAYLLFKLSPETQPFVIQLHPKLIVAEAVGGGKKFTDAELRSGTVSVEDAGPPPYTTCFFFSH